MSNWTYVAIAYTVAWGGLAGYAVVLARRVAQARQVARELRDVAEGNSATGYPAEEQDNAVCDAPPAP